MLKKEASKIVGGLSTPGKMPCYSINLPATECKVGSILAQQAGTTCHGCYALKGRYRFKKTKRAMAWIFSDAILLKNIWSSLINKTFKQLNAERAVRRASYPKGINWFKKKFDRDLKVQASSFKRQAASSKRQAP